tara:strand:+ start:351 stop:1160 length:810 start_codon:yes stop_codon:yes gene_type:complete
MSLLDRFKNKKTIYAHVLDPNTGYTVEEWVVGVNVDARTVRESSEDGNIFVVVVYESSETNRLCVSRTTWDQARREFEKIDKDAQLNYDGIIGSEGSQAKRAKLFEKLVKQAIGTQSVWYSSIFKKGFKIEDSKISKLEITFFTLTTIQMAYLFVGDGSDEDKVNLLDEVAIEILQRSIQGTDVGMDVAVPAFQNRYKEYYKLVNSILADNKVEKDNIQELWTIFYNVTSGNPQDHNPGAMIKLVAYSNLVRRTILDQMEFVREQLNNA